MVTGALQAALESQASTRDLGQDNCTSLPRDSSLPYGQSGLGQVPWGLPSPCPSHLEIPVPEQALFLQGGESPHWAFQVTFMFANDLEDPKQVPS